MNVLLTGATGFLGSHIAKMLIDHGHNIICLVRDKNRLGYIAPVAKDITLFTLDEMEMGKGFRIETVVHTACAYARGNNSNYDVLNSNLIVPFRILELTQQLGVRRWINTGTCLPKQLDCYAMSKHQFNEWGQLYAEMGLLQFVNLELEHFYGRNAPNSHFLTKVIQKLRKNDPLQLTAGIQKRDFIYIGDVIRVYEKILEYHFSDAYVNIPVGTGVAPSIREVVEYLKECMHSNSKLNFGVVPMRKNEPSSHCNTEKLKELEIMPTVTWKNGMKKYLID